MVTTVPGKPLSGVILVIRGLLIVKGMELLQNPFCRICALPELEPDATVVITCPSLQLTTCPGAVPSQTLPLPWVAQNQTRQSSLAFRPRPSLETRSKSPDM